MPYGGRHPYKIASLLYCIEACEALLRGLFAFIKEKNRKSPRFCTRRFLMGLCRLFRKINHGDFIQRLFCLCDYRIELANYIAGI